MREPMTRRQAMWLAVLLPFVAAGVAMWRREELRGFSAEMREEWRFDVILLIPLACYAWIVLIALGLSWPSWLASRARQVGGSKVVLVGMILGVVALLLYDAIYYHTITHEWGMFALFLVPLLPCPVILGWVIYLRHRPLPDPAYRPCAKCGYDLRASTVRCPECGTPIPKATSLLWRRMQNDN